MTETVRAKRRRGGPFYLSALAAPLLTAAACGEPQGLRIGEVEIPYRQIEAAEQSLRRSFPAEGRATLIWHLLDGGLAAEALLHARLPEASRAARVEAEALAARIRAAPDPVAAFREERSRRAEAAEEPVFEKPGPAFLGGSAAARLARMEPGEWTGPLRTERGWELLLLVAREEIPRLLAQVLVERMIVWVGSAADRAQAQADWARLPLSGDPALLDAIPLEARHGRTAAPGARSP